MAHPFRVEMNLEGDPPFSRDLEARKTRTPGQPGRRWPNRWCPGEDTSRYFTRVATEGRIMRRFLKIASLAIVLPLIVLADYTAKWSCMGKRRRVYRYRSCAIVQTPLPRTNV